MLSCHLFVQRRKLELRGAKPLGEGQGAGSLAEPGWDLQVSGFGAAHLIFMLSFQLIGKVMRGEGRDLHPGISSIAGV